MKPSVIASVLVVLLSCRAATVTAAPAAGSIASQLDEAERKYAELEYRDAAELAENVARDPAATPAEQVRAWERVGIAWLVLNQRGLAKEAFDRLFTLEPERPVTDPSLSPRQLEFIDEIRQAHPKPKPVEPPPAVPAPAPAPVPVPVPTHTPVWKRWYLWTPIAVVVVGAGLGIGLGLGLKGSGPTGTLPPGTVGLALRF